MFDVICIALKPHQGTPNPIRPRRLALPPYASPTHSPFGLDFRSLPFHRKCNKTNSVESLRRRMLSVGPRECFHLIPLQMLRGSPAGGGRFRHLQTSRGRFENHRLAVEEPVTRRKCSIGSYRLTCSASSIPRRPHRRQSSCLMRNSPKCSTTQYALSLKSGLTGRWR